MAKDREPSIRVRLVDGVWTGFMSNGSRKTSSGGRKQIRGYKEFPAATCEADALQMARAHFIKANWPLSRALDDYEKHWTIDEGSKQSYRSIRRSLVEQYLEDMPISEITTADLTEWRDDLKNEGLGFSYINKGLAYLSGAFTHFQGNLGLEKNPVKQVARLRQQDVESVYFGYEDFGRLEGLLSDLLDSPFVTDSAHAVRRRMTAFAAYTALHFGLRCGECCALAREDVDRLQNELHVRHNVVGNNGPAHLGLPKGKRTRKMSCADERWLSQYSRHLEFHKQWRGVPLSKGEPLVTFDGDWTRPALVSAEFSTLRDMWGLDRKTHFHSLRHTHATYSLAVLKQDLTEVARRLGHADPATTARIYSHAVPAKDRESAQAFAALSQRMAKEAGYE